MCMLLTSTDFIYSNNKEIIVTTNKVSTSSNLNVVENYIKKLNDVDSSDVMSQRLSQSKQYLKILDILYFVEDTNLLISSNIVESVIKTTHIFNDTVLTSQPCIIKAFLKSDISVIWIDIQNFQNSFFFFKSAIYYMGCGGRPWQLLL